MIAPRSRRPSECQVPSTKYQASPTLLGSRSPARNTHRFLVVTLLLLLVGSLLQPQGSTSHASPASQSGGPGIDGPGTPQAAEGRLYPETGYTLARQFVAFYDLHGAVPTFGYPITDARMENGFLVQWTERQRLEWHPEQAGTDFEVQLGLLGRELTHGLDGPNFQPVAGTRHELPGTEAGGSPPGPSYSALGTHYFPETGQYVDDLFYEYWVRNGGLRVFGYPISAPIATVDRGRWSVENELQPSSAVGLPSSVQWFERARFEVHPENPPETRVLLGHLGYEALKARDLADYKFQVFPAQSVSSSCCPIQQTSAAESTVQIGLAQGGESDDPGFFDNIKDAGAALGPGLVRLDNIFTFYNIVRRAPDGAITYDWRQLDRVLDALRAMDKEPLINLSYMPETLSSTGNSRVLPPASYDEWAALVRATVTHINVDRCSGQVPCPKRVTYWEVWNEPNLWSFWQAPFPDYLKLYDVTVQAAISADPTIKIGGPAVSYFSTDHLGDFLEHERWQVLQGAPARLDFISWHSYGRSADQVAADIRQMRKILEGYPQFHPQLFITEFNVLQGGSGDTSANGYTDTVEGAIAFLSSIESMQRERLDRALLFELKDGPGPSSYWGRWGILTYDGRLKPVYYALEAFQNRSPDPMPVSLLSGPTDGSLGMMAFGGADKATLLLWYTGPDVVRVKVALPRQFDDAVFDVALFDHDNNNPARTGTAQGSEQNAGPTPGAYCLLPAASCLLPSSSLASSGDLVFQLKPFSLVIMTMQSEK